MTSKGEICKQENCAMYNRRIANHCDGLIHAYDGLLYCPFFKSLDQRADETFKRQQRLRKDDDYRRLVEYYASQGH